MVQVEAIEAFRWQAQACADLGSPMYGALLARVADELARADGAGSRLLNDILRGHEHDSGPSALALRLAGAVHRQVLQGDARDLEPFYPSVGGSWDLDPAWPHFLTALRRRGEPVRALLEQAPQTNEVGRAAALMGGLLHATARYGLPVRLSEVGSSGGLNLRADHFRYLRADGSGWGRPDSPVVLDPAWQGAALPDAQPDIIERIGSDPAPVDVATAEGRMTLLSYVWPDQPARLARLRGACEIAGRVPVQLDRTDAVTAVRNLELRAGTTTVLWHSVMWQYLSSADQQAAQARIDQLARQADDDQPFVHLRLEPGRRAAEADREFLVVLEDWPAGGHRTLGTAAPHGVPVTWQ
ncbi:MAG TPA: DUF2332 domain-containing protein [Nocardioidaceae bacterium]|nr:DUF2332 domain-containing protein [Nocardioidaceae bacterium]